LKFLASLEPVALLLLRCALGVIFITHGYPKLIHGTGMQSFFVEHGLPGYFVFVAAVIELFGGALLVLGLFTRGAALLLTMEMLVAIWKVHFTHGIFGVHEYEFPLSMAAACFALAAVGAGAISIDHPLFGGGKSRSAQRR